MQDSTLLLTAEKLYLEQTLLRGKKVNGTYAFKRPESQTYLVVNELQARILEEFATPKSVPEVLEACIRRRSCTALREFYDLILKAHQAGVLRSEELAAEGPAPFTRPPVRWWLALSPTLVLAATVLGFAATLAILWLRPPVLPAAPADWAIGWLATCVALSLGQVIAASVLRAADGEVHEPGWKWLLVFPHFAADLRDTCMMGRRTRAATLGATLLPLCAAVAAALWFRPAWACLPLAALFAATLPFGQSVPRQFLLLLRRTPLVATDDAPLFAVPMSVSERCWLVRQRFDLRIAALQFLAALAWAAGLAFTAYRSLQLDPAMAFKDPSLWQQSVLGVDIALVALLLLWGANAVQHNVADAIGTGWRRWSMQGRRWLARQPRLSAEDAAELLIRRNPLLSRLDPEIQLELARHVRPFTAGPWSRIIAFDDDPQFVGLILSGSATVHRRLKSGRKARFLRLVEGDLFGAHRMVDPDIASLEIRTRTPLWGLAIEREAFQRLVINTLGAAAVRNYVHKHLFLQRATPVCAEWRPAAVARFAELAATAAHAAGGKIIARDQEVASLYVLYEGQARALQNGKSLGRIAPGDFFGEVSLLQASAATADVESNDDSRCLVVNRVEFIRFMSRNHHVALQIERLCSKRLGRPVFPIDDRGFDAA